MQYYILICSIYHCYATGFKNCKTILNMIYNLIYRVLQFILFKTFFGNVHVEVSIMDRIKKESVKKIQHGTIENVAGLV
jgi:hypothetical protein